MRRLLSVGLMLLAVAPAVARAQSGEPSCPVLLTADACRKAGDLFLYVAPQLGTIIAGGSPVLGQGAVLSFMGSGRAFPGVSVGLRLNVLNASVPDLRSVPISLTGPSNSAPIPVEDRLVVGPTFDAVVGVFRGFALGPTDVLGFDLLASALLLPDIDEPGIRISTPGSGFRLGLGARVALLQESIVTPSVTVSYLRRELPTVDIIADAESGSASADVTVRGLEKRTDSWRVILSKSFAGFSLAVGGGGDAYTASGVVSAQVNGVPSGVFAMQQEVTRANVFTGLTFNVGPARLAAEIGRVSGGEIQTFNVFAGDSPDSPRLYGSLGFRVSF